MSKFDFFLMKDTDVIEYTLKNVELFNGNSMLKCKEICVGNLNYVYRVLDENSPLSVIIKQAGHELCISKDMKI